MAWLSISLSWANIFTRRTRLCSMKGLHDRHVSSCQSMCAFGIIFSRETKQNPRAKWGQRSSSNHEVPGDNVIVSGGYHNFYCNSPLGKIWASLSGLGNIVSGVRSCHRRKEALTINVETFSQMRCPRRLSLHLLVLWGK